VVNRSLGQIQKVPSSSQGTKWTLSLTFVPLVYLLEGVYFVMRICILFTLAIIGCRSADKAKPRGAEMFERLEHEFSPWKNEYRNDAQLAGVIVNKYMEGIQDPSRYIGKHPASIWYVFWNGDVRANMYNPDGSIDSSQLWKGYFKPGPEFWNDVDFNHGNDPEFKRHRDPRK
jgi:hypothetical protein